MIWVSNALRTINEILLKVALNTIILTLSDIVSILINENKLKIIKIRL
jgi:hypothetical protein